MMCKNFFSDNKVAISCGILGLIILSVFGSVFLIAKTVEEIKKMGQNDNPYYNSLNISGMAEVVAIPDVASFNFAVNETSMKVEDAQKIATEKINKALDYLKSQGVEEKDIKTTAYNINPKYEWQQGFCNEMMCDGGKSVLLGYEITQNVDVKVREVAKAGELLAGIGAMEITNVSGLQFKVDDDELLKDEARAKAIADAKKKVESIASSLGVKVVRVIGYYEEADMGAPYYGGYGMGGDMMMEKAVSIAPELPMGENKIVSRVNVTFEIK